MKEQKRLSEVFRILDSRGCFVMLSNSEHALTRELYRDYEKNTVMVRAKRMINSVGSKRGAISEVVVTNYSTADKVGTSLLSQVILNNTTQ
jgi:DNA adenine methylase